MVTIMPNDLPTPPMEPHIRPTLQKKTSKSPKPHNRVSKRTSTCSDHGPVGILDGRHKRVWKACERCRMKKTKCDGENPCKRCKDDGLVCTAGSRKKTEFKQLPRGYAEVLEHTQYALIATVHKLYDMLRRGEEWTYGEPELNDRGLPVIHNIAEKLGCIRQAPDVSYTFPEGEEDFLELQHRLQASVSLEGGSESTKPDPHDSEHTLDRTERASSSESEHSIQSSACNSLNQATVQHGQETEQKSQPQIKQETPSLKLYNQSRLQQIQIPRRSATDFCKLSNPPQLPSPRSAFTPEGYGPESPFTNFALGSDDFLGPAPALDVTAQYLNTRQQSQGSVQQQKPPRFSFSQSLPYNLGAPNMGANPSDFTSCGEIMNMNYYSGVTGTAGDGTIRPGMLEAGMDFDFDRLDAGDMLYDYAGENTMMMA